MIQTSVHDIPNKEQVFYSRRGGGAGAGELQLFRIAVETWGPKLRLLRHLNQTSMIGYTTDGCGELATAEGVVPIPANSVFVVGKCQYAVLRCVQAPMHLVLLDFSPACNAVLRQLFNTLTCVIPVAAPAITQGFFAELFALAAGRKPFAANVITYKVLLFLAECAQERAAARSQHDPGYETFLRCKTYLDRHYQSICTIAELGQACGITAEHISRLFRRYLQSAPYEYLTNLKISHACHSLTGTSQSVRAIAAALSYETPSAFSRAFKRRIGVSPNQYRSRGR